MIFQEQRRWITTDEIRTVMLTNGKKQKGRKTSLEMKDEKCLI